MNTIKKRNGDIVPFNPDKIHNAMRKAFIACGWEADDESLDGFLNILTKRVVDRAIASNSDSVEQIQDHVEMILMEAGEYRVAKAYVEYRYSRSLARKSNTTDESIMSLLRDQNKELKEENSNKSTVIASTQRDYIAGEVSRDLTRRILLPPDVSKAHDEAILHFHDMDYFVQPIFNCFSSKTKFVTDRGIKAFNDFKDGETVAVLTKDGFYSQATVRCYGKQPLYDITLRKNGMSRVVTATKNHRWILSDGSVTTDLKVGDALFPLMDITPYTTPKTKRDCEMFALGFAIGDGSDSIQKGINLRLCGEKNKYLNYFITAGWAVMPGGKDSNNDNFLYLSMDISKQDVLNGCIWRYLDLNDKIMLFSGYYAADGCKDRDMIFTADDRVAMMIEEISAIAGYHIVSHSIKYKDTPYKENVMLHHFRFNRYHYRNWSVESIVPHRRDLLPQDVWCVEEPVTHSFTLEGGIVTGNCCLINIGDMLDNGTVMNGRMIETPKSFQVACTVMTQIVATVASNQYGGQSVDLRHLGKYLRRSREKLTKRFTNAFPDMNQEDINKLVDIELKEELKSGVQTIQYQINSLMTTNGQSPFVTLFLYLAKDDPYIEENAMIIEEVLKQRLQGIKNECGVYTTPAFPKLVYVLDDWNNLTGGKYDYITKLACKCTAKRMYPDYISAKKMRENYEGNVFSPMGCRSFLAPWKDENGNYKFEGRFNQGVVSINLPQIGIIANGDEEKFWSLLDERLELCKKALMCRHEALKRVSTDNSPIHWQHGCLARLPKHSTIEPLLYGGYSSISLGYIGLYETTIAMKGVSHTTEVGKEFALRVLKHLREACDRWKKETNIGFALYGTPAESLAYRFARIDRDKFGDIPNITDKGYYTNSYHVDVREKINAFDKLKFEAQFQPISSGGCISYAEIPNLQKNVEAIEAVVRFIYDNIQYAEFNTKSDYCHVCGFDGEIIVNDDLEWVCPCCGNKDKAKMNVVRRTCGLKY